VAYIEVNIDATARYESFASLDEGEGRAHELPFFTEWLRHARWCEKFEKDHPADVAGLQASYRARAMYTDYIEKNEYHEIACELGHVNVVQGIGRNLHYRLSWCRMFREHFPEPVEMMESRSQGQVYRNRVLLERVRRDAQKKFGSSDASST